MIRRIIIQDLNYLLWVFTALNPTVLSFNNTIIHLLQQCDQSQAVLQEPINPKSQQLNLTKVQFSIMQCPIQVHPVTRFSHSPSLIMSPIQQMASMVSIAENESRAELSFRFFSTLARSHTHSSDLHFIIKEQTQAPSNCKGTEKCRAHKEYLMRITVSA